jgi:hypothetical protein
MGSHELYFYVWALYGKTENLKYVALRLHQNECLAAEVFVDLEKQMKNFIQNLGEQFSLTLKG